MSYSPILSQKGTVHIVVGSAGFELGDAGINEYQWSLNYERSFGYLRVVVASASALCIDYIRNIDRTVADRVWLKKWNLDGSIIIQHFDNTQCSP